MYPSPYLSIDLSIDLSLYLSHPSIHLSMFLNFLYIYTYCKYNIHPAHNNQTVLGCNQTLFWTVVFVTERLSAWWIHWPICLTCSPAFDSRLITAYAQHLIELPTFLITQGTSKDLFNKLCLIANTPSEMWSYYPHCWWNVHPLSLRQFMFVPRSGTSFVPLCSSCQSVANHSRYLISKCQWFFPVVIHMCIWIPTHQPIILLDTVG